MDAGAGDDTITNEGSNSLLEGKDGNDYIEGIENYYVTADGGGGNDTITGTFYYGQDNSK